MSLEAHGGEDMKHGVIGAFEAMLDPDIEWSGGETRAMLLTDGYEHRPDAETLSEAFLGQEDCMALPNEDTHPTVRPYMQLIYVDDGTFLRHVFQFCVNPIVFKNVTLERDAGITLLYKNGLLESQKLPLTVIKNIRPIPKNAPGTYSISTSDNWLVRIDASEYRSLKQREWMLMHGSHSLN